MRLRQRMIEIEFAPCSKSYCLTVSLWILIFSIFVCVRPIRCRTFLEDNFQSGIFADAYLLWYFREDVAKPVEGRGVF